MISNDKINSTKIAIDNLIDVMESEAFSEEASLFESMDIISTKKSAFVSAKDLIGKLQRMELTKKEKTSEDWYRGTIQKLVRSAQDTSHLTEVVLRKKISIADDRKASHIAKDIEDKPNALNYRDEMHSGIVELSDIIKSIDDGRGMKMINDHVLKTGFAEKYAFHATDFFPKRKRKIEPGYNKDLDAIVISYDGTIGDIIECYGLRIALPKTPSKSSMQNARKKPAAQYWERPEQPEGLEPNNVSSYYEHIEEEFRRKDEGFWFMNNGEPEYITGAYYMLLTHFRTDAEGGYFHFRKAHRDLFYFWEACWVDDRCLGSMLGKTRRTGASYCACAFCETKGISMKDAHVGAISKTNTDAIEFFNKMSVMFMSLPFYFKPLNTGEGYKDKLVFTRPAQKTTKKSFNKRVIYDQLNTDITIRATKENSYDSMTMKIVVEDEFSKWETGDILKHWEKLKKTLTKGGRIHGKVLILSTVEDVTGLEHNSKDAGCGDRFKWLYENSDPLDRNDVGRTKTGLYKIFISAIDNYEGFIDRYGNCIYEVKEGEVIEGVDGRDITTGVLDFLDNEWEVHKDSPADLNDAKRKDPITEDDMFRVVSSNTQFNLIKLQDEINFNNEYELAHGNPRYKVGNLMWKNNVPFTTVEFHENKNGSFAISWFPDSSLANGHILDGDRFKPANSFLGAFGIDPYKFDETVDKKGSKGSIVGYLGNHPLDGVPKDEFFLLYLHKPQTLDVFFDDAMKCMWYYGMPALIENNVPEMLTVMHGKGMSPYSMRRPDKSIKDLAKHEKIYGGIPSQDRRLIFAQAAFLERYIEYFLGHRDDGRIGTCPFNRLLIDFMSFDVSNRTKFDASVAAGLAVYAANKVHAKVVADKAKGLSSKSVNIYDMVKLYKYS